MYLGLTDEGWAMIAPLLPPTRQSDERRDDRQVLNGIFCVLSTGIAWDELPSPYSPHPTIYKRVNRWATQGIWQRLFEEFSCRRLASPETIDTTAIKGDRAAAGTLPSSTPSSMGLAGSSGSA